MSADAIAVVRRFIAAVNRRSVDDLRAVMADDHTFIDSQGRALVGREEMMSAWRAYFAMFPDYEIRVHSILADGDRVAVFGEAFGTFNGKRGLAPENRIVMPAAWNAGVKDGRVAFWQVYADWTEGMKIIEREKHEGEQPAELTATSVPAAADQERRQP
jgi:limonene-1,2-epoxide hydrolase